MGDKESAIIKLDEKNFARGNLEDGKSILLLFDSGATRSIMSRSCVLNSTHLSSKKLTKVEPVQFKLGNGQYISADAQVEFVVTIQGHKFQVSALVAPDLVGIDVILGSRTLKELQGVLDFSTNCFRIRSRKTYAKPVHRLTIHPGQTKYVNLRVRAPPFARNAEVVAYPTNFVSSMCPSAMLVKVRKGRTRILLKNTSSRPFTVTNRQNLAYVNWADIVTVTQEVPRESVDQVMSHRYSNGDPGNSRFAQSSSHVPMNSENRMGFHLNHSHSEINREDLRRYNLERYPHLDYNDPVVEMTSEEIVKRDIDLNKSILNDSEKRKVFDMVVDYREAFSLYGELSSCPDFEADITLTNDEPFFIRPYRLSEDDKHIVSRELDKLVKLGILAVGHQSYTSPVFLIPKKGTQDKRVVTDFRYLNDRIKRINHPFPLLDETLCTIGNSGAQVLSVLDLKSAFFCLPLSSRAQQYTGVASYYGGRHYYYKRLPQGLNLSPAIFQAKIDDVLATIPNSGTFCIAHHDDIIVYSKDKQSHQQHLEQIFETLVAHGLKISPKKCALFRNSVVYMGHSVFINAEGQACVQPLQNRCRAISNTPVPHSLQAVRRFVGAVNYVSQFFPRLQEILKPLHALSRKRKGFLWTTEHQQVFDKVRDLMCRPPVLHMPQKNGRFRLYSDTSRIATGSYVTQIVNGKEHLLGYYSKVLPEACLRYSVTELELFGLLVNVTAFKYLLRGVEFDAFVDHSAIKDILISKNEPPTARVRRMLFRLSEYTLKIGYKKGSELVLADYLSRAPQEGDSEIDRVIPVAFSAVSSQSEVELTEVIVEKPSTHMVNPVLTRSMAREQGVMIPEIFPSKETSDSPATPTPTRTVPAASFPSLSTPQVFSPPLRGSVVRENESNTRSQQTRMGNPIPCPELQRPNPERIRSEAELVVPELPSTSHNRAEFPPATRLFLEPRLVDRVGLDKNEVIREPPSELFKPSTPLIPKIGDIKANHIPKQKELQRIMKNIQRKVIRDYNLPFDMHELQIQQETSPSFKPVYDFLAHDILPSDIKSARAVTAKAEQFILCNGLLFRLFLHDKYDSKMTLQLVIPDTMVDKVITKYHDDILSNHQGVMRTYLTIRQNFFMRNMFQRISNYIQACLRCQEFKGKPDKLRPFHSRVPDSYRPFDRISLDFKSMPTSVSGYKHLMVACDEITRFVVCVPLKALDAGTVCEAILQKIVTVFGPPSQLVTDAASALTSKIAELLCKTLGIEQKCVSVCNHGSLQVERQIQTLSNFLKVNLNQFGMDWVRYVPTTAYAYNAFSSPHLGNYSPFELAFGRKPPNLTGLAFNPMSGLTQSHGEYAASLKKRFDHLSQVMLNLQRHHQNAQQVKISNKLSKSPIYSEGQLVYLYKPTSSSLTANSRKIAAEWCGPLIIHQVLDRTHYLLTTLKGEILRDVFNFNRLKPCFIRSSSDAPHITDIATLKRMLTSGEAQNDKSVEKTNGVHVMFHDENGQALPEVTSSDILCTGLTDVVEPSSFLPNESNQGLASLDELGDEVIAMQRRILCKARFQGMLVKRARYKAGNLQVLTSILDDQSRQVYTFWWNVGSYANTEDILDFLLENNVEITGAPQRMLLRLFA